MATVQSPNPVNPPPLPIEQVPPNITIPAFAPEKKSSNAFSLFFNFLFFIFGIAGIGYGVYVQQTFVHPLILSSLKSSLKVSITPVPPTKIPVSLTPSISSPPKSSSSSAQTIMKETLCYTLYIPKNNDAGAENNCDLSYRSFPDPQNPEVGVSIGISLHNKTYTNSEDMATQWLQLEKDHGSEDTLIEKGPVQVGAVEGYRVITEYANKAVQTTHIFVHHPNKYEAYGYPITGFELLTSSDANTRMIQQKELERLLSTWTWK